MPGRRLRERRRPGESEPTGYGPTTLATRRSLVTMRRLEGRVVDWHEKFGWIEPSLPIEHPQAAKHSGKVYVAAEDTQQPVGGVGASVTFFAYADANGLGAMHVRLASSAESMAALPALPEGPHRSLAVGPYATVPKERQVPALCSGLAPRGGYRPCRGRSLAQTNPKEVLDAMHSALWNLVLQAVQNVAELEEEWSTQEMTRRIVKHFYKAGQSPELFLMPWAQATKQFVEHAMQGYSSSCGDKLWFFELEVAPALAAGAWEIVKASGAQPRGGFPAIERTATEKCEELMDATLLDKAMWDSTRAVFGQGPVCSKIYKFLLVARGVAFNKACADSRPLKDLQRVEAFVRGCRELLYRVDSSYFATMAGWSTA